MIRKWTDLRGWDYIGIILGLYWAGKDGMNGWDLQSWDESQMNKIWMNEWDWLSWDE